MDQFFVYCIKKQRLWLVPACFGTRSRFWLSCECIGCLFFTLFISKTFASVNLRALYNTPVVVSKEILNLLTASTVSVWRNLVLRVKWLFWSRRLDRLSYLALDSLNVPKNSSQCDFLFLFQTRFYQNLEFNGSESPRSTSAITLNAFHHCDCKFIIWNK